MMYRCIGGWVLLLLLNGCGKETIHSFSAQNLPVNSTLSNHAIDSIAQPYRERMHDEMSSIIGYADSALMAYAPESPLGNFAADVAFEAGFDYARLNGICSDSNRIFSLLNFGGLRTSIGKGSITRGDIYELMPFDNALVIVQLPAARMDSLLTYLALMKGQPVSNARFDVRTDSRQFTIGAGEATEAASYFVITSDYLSNGGDKMDFFKGPMNTWNTGILIREALMSFVEKEQHIPYYPVEGRVRIDTK